MISLIFCKKHFINASRDRIHAMTERHRQHIDSLTTSRADLTTLLKGRLDCDSWRVFYTTLEATQTRRTDLWVFTLLLSESRLFCVFLFLNDRYFTEGSPLDRCVQQLAIGLEYNYITCVLLMVCGDYLCNHYIFDL